MADIVDTATRSRMMSGIRGKDTKPEMLVRRGLHRMGFRFSLHRSNLPGKPDLVFTKWHAVVLIHGCFWHRHMGCRFSTTPATRPDFWKQKFDANAERDARAEAALRERGWRIARVWECSLKSDADSAIGRLAEWLTTDESAFEV